MDYKLTHKLMKNGCADLNLNFKLFLYFYILLNLHKSIKIIFLKHGRF